MVILIKQGGDFMLVGIPREIKDNENRVAIVPAGVDALVKRGHQVLIETNAGMGSGITDDEYKAVGAEIVATAAEVYERAEMIMKVKEPLPVEYGYFREGQVIFTYLHLAPEPDLTRAMLDSKVVGIAYETVQLPDNSLPLLSPMSEIAGRMSVQVGAHFLEKTNGGAGVLLGGVAGVPPAKVLIVGGGTVGTNAAKVAVGMGAQVTLVDININRLRYLDEIFQGRITTLMSNSFNIARAVKEADLVIGAVLIPGAKTPVLVTEEMVKTMSPGSVLVDVAIDQGGSIETMDRITSHSDPIFIKHGVVHYCVPNIPGAVARTATFALTNATLPYALQIANKGWKQAVRDNQALAKGVNVASGMVTYEAVAKALNYPYHPLEEVL